MSGYAIFNLNVNNPENYKEYIDKVKPTAEKFGGEYLTRGGEMDVVLQDLWKPTRLVLVKFPSMKAVREWLDSPEYKEVSSIRLENSVGTFVVLEGI